MVTLKGLSRILAVGEKNIFREISEILVVAEEANRVMRQMMREHQSGATMSESAQAIRLLEKKSDDIAFKVGEDITSGAISPNVLDDLLESVRLADTILDLYYNVSREMNRMSKVELEDGENSEDDEWGVLFLKMSDLAGKAILKVEELLATPNLVRMVEVRKEIEALEEQGDDVKDSGFDKLYVLTPKLNYIQFVHYSEMLHKLDDILDACEDLSDMIVSIVNSILK
jgi:uncharacterized protein Yka (UPF0111/DUF47 family)